METLVNMKTWLAGGSIFTAIQTAENFPFFSDNTPAELDQMLSLTYGQRMVTSAFNNFDINTAGKFITKLYGEKWKALIEFNISAPDLGAKSVTKTTGNQNTVGTKNDVSNSENKEGLNDEQEQRESDNSDNSDDSGNDYESEKEIADLQAVIDNPESSEADKQAARELLNEIKGKE